MHTISEETISQRGWYESMVYVMWERSAANIVKEIAYAGKTEYSVLK